MSMSGKKIIGFWYIQPNINGIAPSILTRNMAEKADEINKLFDNGVSYPFASSLNHRKWYGEHHVWSFIPHGTTKLLDEYDEIIKYSKEEDGVNIISITAICKADIS